MFALLKSAFAPQSILYPPYLLSAFAITTVWLVNAQRMSVQQSFELIISRSNWLNHSSLADVLLWTFNLALVGSALTACESGLFDHALELASRLTRHIPWNFALPAPLEAIGATLATMLAIDGTSYAVHRLMHRFQFLWLVHAVHHSAEKLTPLTTYRQHPLELFVLNGARVVAAGIALALYHGFFKAQTPVLTVAEIGAGFFIYMFTVNLHHSFVPVRYPSWLRCVLVSPHLHHIHHSIEPHHQNRNFSVVFSFWDRIFHTYHEEEIGLQTLRFGLCEENRYRHSIVRCVMQPVVDIGVHGLSVMQKLPSFGRARSLLLDPLATLFLAVSLLGSGSVS